MSDVTEYHERSKHHLHGYAPGPGRLDWANQPDPWRRFAGAPLEPLPLGADTLDRPFADLREKASDPRPLARASLAILLELSLGLSAWKSYRGSRWALRCNPSSGNLHPTEGYYVAPNGVWHYVSHDHGIERRADGAAWPLPPEVVLIGLTSIHWREAWKYGMRAFRYCQHDTGHAIAAVRYAAAVLGWRARVIEAAGDDDVAEILGVARAEDFEDAEPEAPEVLIAVGPGDVDAQLDLDALVAASRAATWAGRANRLSVAHVEWPWIDRVAAATSKPRTDEGPGSESVRATRGGVWCPPTRHGAGARVRAADLIRQRRSAVAFDGRTGISQEVFFGMLASLRPREAVAPWDAIGWEPRVHPVFFVHRVEGLDPGLYALPRREGIGETMRAAMHDDFAWEPVQGYPDLKLLVPIDTRGAAQTIACHQEIASDSAFALGMLAEMDAALAAYGDWFYRALYWECGVLGQVLYLESEAAGIRATGIGCFFDDAMHATLGLPRGSRAFQSLYHFTAGGPVEDTRLETLPPHAHLVR